MRFRRVFSDIVCATAVFTAACTPARSGPPPAPVPARVVDAEAPSPDLPPIPVVTGPVAVRIIYPAEGQVIQARDSNFIFGSVGTGGVQLTIDGYPVDVRANGAFLAYLPVPRADAPSYQLVVSRGRDTVRVSHRVGVLPPRPALSDGDPVAIDAASVQPSPRTLQELAAGDTVRVSVRASRTSRVVLRLATGVDIPLQNLAANLDSVPNALAARGASGDPSLWATDVGASVLAGAATTIVARRGADSVLAPGPRVSVPVEPGRQFVVVGTAPSTVSDTDRVVIGKPVIGGTYKWFLLPGTIVEQTGRVGEAVRLRLDRSLEVWVDASEVTPLGRGVAAPRRVAANARVIAGPTGEWSDVVIPMTERPAYSVEEGGAEGGNRSIVLTVYGTQANTDIVNVATAAGNVERVVWEQVTNDRAKYTIRLTHAPYGYLVRWERGALVVRVRRPPVIDRQRPLAGLTIAVDAGHPPAGSTGPTGLYEAVATLAIAQRVASLLEARGAKVVMTRTAPGAVGLGDRPIMARRANAHAFVSIHLNALPDGVNPFHAHGTGAYYFNGHSIELARQVQRGMVRRMGLRDLGTNYDNLAVLRPTWMPAVLCEGAFVIIPEQEAALRTPEFQQRYAEGVVEGLEGFFRGLGDGGS
ncbi:MAG: N-acetylmuramoyl-L-alanine amidase [Gemmatimonadaceae bacterium]